MTQAQHAPSSLAVSLALLPPSETQTFLDKLTDEEAAALLYDWEFWARPLTIRPTGDYGGQMPPPLTRAGEAWTTWLILAGRGYGKTRVGAEWVRAEVESERRGRLAIVGRTAADVRDVMVEGPTGILSISPPWNRPKYEPSKRRLTWSNGAVATTFTADEPDLLRGPQFDGAWCDELAAWRFEEAWDNLQFGMRLGDNPQAVVTTTPKPVKLIKQLVKDPTTAITRGSSYENRANLARSFFQKIVAKYEGTRIGRQELNAELLEDVEGALWQREAMIEQHRVRRAPDLIRVVVGVDPEATSTEGSAETGIIVAGVGADGHGYVLDDLSVHGSPHEWALQAVTGYYKYRGDRIIGEQNNGGEMVEATIRTVDAAVSYEAVYASRGKLIRAEPISSLYEQGKVHHVGTFPELEDQLCNWIPGDKSPDRLDALVWALTKLMLKEDKENRLVNAPARVVRADDLFR